MNNEIMPNESDPVNTEEYICQVCRENVADNYDTTDHLFICEACWQLKVEDFTRGPSC